MPEHDSWRPGSPVVAVPRQVSPGASPLERALAEEGEQEAFATSGRSNPLREGSRSPVWHGVLREPADDSSPWLGPGATPGGCRDCVAGAEARSNARRRTPPTDVLPLAARAGGSRCGQQRWAVLSGGYIPRVMWRPWRHRVPRRAGLHGPQRWAMARNARSLGPTAPSESGDRLARFFMGYASVPAPQQS